MSRSTLLLLLMILAAPVSSGAEQRDPKLSCGRGFWDENAEPAAQQPPDGFSKGRVLAGMGVTGEVCGWAVKAWGREHPLYVAVVDQGESLFLGVFEQGDPIRLRARRKLVLGEAWVGFHHFDFAPYRISPDEIAIGIRTASPVAYAGGGGRCEGLSLFRLREDRLDLVLYTLMDYSAMIRGEEIEAGLYAHYDVSAAASLAVSDQKTGGFFDLVKSIEETGPDAGPDRSAVYKWSGDRYQPEGDVEPLEANCLVVGFDFDRESRGERFPEWVAY